jgi:hypothetical protein
MQNTAVRKTGRQRYLGIMVVPLFFTGGGGRAVARYAEGKLKMVEHVLGASNQPARTGCPIVLEELDPANGTFDQLNRLV